MSDDLLRAADAWSDEDPAYVPGGIIKRLAARVRELEAERDALRAEVKRLRGALKQFAECNLNDSNCSGLPVATARIRNIANAALAGEKT